MKKTEPHSHLDFLRAYAEQWTPEQLREAIFDEKVTDRIAYSSCRTFEVKEFGI